MKFALVQERFAKRFAGFPLSEDDNWAEYVAMQSHRVQIRKEDEAVMIRIDDNGLPVWISRMELVWVLEIEPDAPVYKLLRNLGSTPLSLKIMSLRMMLVSTDVIPMKESDYQADYKGLD